jgi:hypothetical protein
MTRDPTIIPVCRCAAFDADHIHLPAHAPGVERSLPQCGCSYVLCNDGHVRCFYCGKQPGEPTAPAPRPSEAPRGCPECGKLLGHTFECSHNTGPASLRSGRPSEAPAPPCPECDGEGKVYIDDAEGIEPYVNCPICKGAGTPEREP